MKHRMAMRKLGRDRGHRRALLRNQVTSLIEHERIETTVAKAKELRRVADKMVTYGKTGTLFARRAVAAYVQTPAMVQKLLKDVAPRFADRCGGYTRVLRTRNRRGDAAEMAVVELVGCERSILTAGQLREKELRKTKYRRGTTAPRGLADALDEGDSDGMLDAEFTPLRPRT
jgi:large subunit ribosomal protein L17